MNVDLSSYLQTQRERVDAALQHYVTDAALVPPRLAEAMRYSLMAGGKRLRPILVIAAAEAVGGSAARVLPCACAMEMIHTFSLIHDDLPAMDDDDLRRGQPTNHKVFGEAGAILAGDALLAEAFWCLADPAFCEAIPSSAVLAVIRDIAAATGARGMVAGQMLDMQAERQTLTPEAVTQLHAYKTGALIRVAVTSGARLSGANATALAALTDYGTTIGLAFQIADDLLAIDGSEAQLGKRVGNDAAHAKATYPAMAGADAARARMQVLTAEAIEALRPLGTGAEPLRALAAYVTARTS